MLPILLKTLLFRKKARQFFGEMGCRQILEQGISSFFTNYDCYLKVDNKCLAYYVKCSGHKIIKSFLHTYIHKELSWKMQLLLSYDDDVENKYMRARAQKRQFRSCFPCKCKVNSSWQEVGAQQFSIRSAIHHRSNTSTRTFKRESEKMREFFDVSSLGLNWPRPRVQP